MSSSWLTIEEAARRANQNAGHVRRRAAGWIASGLAREVAGGGKRRRYEIREDADAAFARVKFPEQIKTDLRALTDAKRGQAAKRRQILDEWSKAKQAAFTLGFDAVRATNHFCERLLIDKGIKVSPRTLYNWEAGWRAEGLAGLVDARGLSTKDTKGHEEDPFLAEVQRLYLRVRKLKLTVCHEIATMTAAEKGWEAKSYKACQRHIASLPAAVVTKFRHGEEAYVNQCEPFIQRDYTTLESNEVLCGDHHQFDVLVNAGTRTAPELIRPWLTVWQDMRSRMIVGWTIFPHAPNTDTILAAFRMACLEHGVPQGVYVDNGKDYDSYALNGRTKKDRWRKVTVKVEIDTERTAGVFTQLGVSVTHAWAYHGQSKPVERFFGTVEQSTPVWDTYCGRATHEKPEDLQLQIERGKAPLLADFVAWFGDWLAAHHNTSSLAQGLEGQSPAACFAAHLHSKRTASAELLAALCLRRTKPCNIGQNGVNYRGIWYGAHEPALFGLQGKTQVVLAVDDQDVSAVQVWSVDGKFICLATANQMVPANATNQELSAAIKQKKAHRKKVREYHEVRTRLADDLPEAILRAKAAKIAAGQEQNTGGPPVPPPNLRPVRSDVEQQLPAVQRATEFLYGRQTGTDAAAPLPPASRFTYKSDSFSADDDQPRFNYSIHEGHE